MDYRLDRVIMNHIEKTLIAHNGRRKETYTALGISKATFYRYLAVINEKKQKSLEGRK